jgi:mycothiol synthase
MSCERSIAGVAVSVAEKLLLDLASTCYTLRGEQPAALAALAAEATHRLRACEGQHEAGLLIARVGEKGARVEALGVATGRRRRGVARALVEDLLVSLPAGTGVATRPIDQRDAEACAFFAALGWTAEEPSGVRMQRDLDDLPPLHVPAGYRLRTYLEGDDEAWMRVIREAFATEAGGHAPTDPDAFRREYLENPLFHPSRIFFAVREEDNEVGGTTSSWETEVEGRRVGLIHWVAVAPDHRGRGLGEALNLAALHDMRARGHREAHLNTSRELPHAVRLYERLGFRAPRRWVIYRCHASG